MSIQVRKTGLWGQCGIAITAHGVCLFIYVPGLPSLYPACLIHSFLGGVPELEAVRLTLVAVTSTNCNEAYDLELPELLGDAVIKHAVSVHGYLIR